MERAVTAMGGPKVVDGIRTLEIHAKAVRVLPTTESLPVGLTLQMAFPDRFRQVLEINGIRLETVTRPEGTYTDMGDGPVLMPDEQRKELEDGFRRNLITLLKGRGSATIHSTGAVEGGEEIEMTANGLTLALVLDPASGRPVRMRFPDLTGARPFPNTTTYANWRTVSGLTYPFVITTSKNGEPTNTLEIQTLSVDPSFDPQVFEPRSAPVRPETEGTAPPPASATPQPHL